MMRMVLSKIKGWSDW